jgi:hypothetical protein
MSAFTALGPVGIELLKSWDLGARLRNYGYSGARVLHARSRYRERYEQSHRINDEVTFSSLDRLVCIESVITSLWRSAVRLSVNHCRCRRTRASHACSLLFAQPVLHLLKHARLDPARERLVDFLPRQERLG